MSTSKEASKGISNGGLWGAVVGTVGDLATGFNYKQQENQIELARIQAEQAKYEAEARKSSSPISGIDSKVLIVGGIVIAFIFALIMFKK